MHIFRKDILPIVHDALWMFGNYYTSHKPGTMQLAFIIIAALILLVGVAYLVMVVYDISVRKYLSDKRAKRLAKQKLVMFKTPDFY